MKKITALLLCAVMLASLLTVAAGAATVINDKTFTLGDVNKDGSTKKALIGNYIKMFNDVSAIAHSFMSNVFKDISLFDFFEIVDTITKEDIERRFETYFKNDVSVLSIVNPD